MKKSLILPLLLFCASYSNAQIDATVLNFDGDNDFVNVGNDNVFNYSTTSTFTIEAWIKPNTTATSWRVIAARESWTAGVGWLFYVYNNRLYFRTPSAQVFTNEIILNDVWSHVAVTFSATSIVMYLNGTNVASGNFSIAISSNQSMYIGARHLNNGNGSTDYFSGDMDEVRFWSTSKTGTEISLNYECALEGSETNLTSYYNFNQGFDNTDNSSQTTLISSNTTYNGTLNNFSLTGSISNFFDGSLNGVDDCETLSNEFFNSGLNDISLYPNPTKNAVYLKNINNSKSLEVQIFDINSKSVLKLNGNYFNSSNKIDLQNFNPGLYLLSIKSEGYKTIKKLIVK